MATSSSNGSSALLCEIVPERDCVRVVPGGELDIATVDTLDEELRALYATGFDRVILDLSRLTFIDSTGLRLLLIHDADARSDGHSFTLTSATPTVQRVFEVTGLMDRLPFATNGSC